MATIQMPVDVKVTIDGAEYQQTLLSVELDQFTDAHHTLKIDIVNPDAHSSFVDPTTSKDFLGKDITVTMAYTTTPDSVELTFVGIITQFSLINSVDGLNITRLTASSPTIKLDGARKYAIYQETKASEAISRLANDHSLSGSSIANTSHQYQTLWQHNETDWDFMRRMAAINGLCCFYDGEKLRVEAPRTAVDRELTFREDLGSFSLGIGVAQPAYRTVVYSEADDSVLTADSPGPAGSASGIVKTALDTSKSLLSGKTFSRVGTPGMDASETDKQVQHEHFRARDRMFDCEGTSGHLGIKVGTTIKIKGLGGTDSAYYVTAIYHRLAEGGYENTFECRPVDAAFPQRPPDPEPLAGLLRGIVTNNQDPLNLGRVKVNLSWLPEEETDWLRLASPYAGNQHGWYVIPEVGDEVLVGYVNGDFQQLVVLGSFYNKTNEIPPDSYNPDNDIKMFYTRGGQSIAICDTEGSETIAISSPGAEHTVILSKADQCITIKTTGELKLEADENISITSKKDIILKADGKINAEAMGEIGMKSTSGDASLEGLNVEVKAQVGVKATGSATAELSASGQTTVKGAMVMIN